VRHFNRVMNASSATVISVLAAAAAAAAALVPSSLPPALGAAPPAAVECVPIAHVQRAPQDRYGDRSTVVSDGAVRYAATVSHAVVRPGRPVGVSLRIRNTGAAAVTWSFPTLQRFDAIVYDSACRESWRWSRGRMFAQMVGALTLGPEEITSYGVRWDQRDNEGRQAAPGAYELRVVFLGRPAPRAAAVILPPLLFEIR
jgi:hypothetical protein